MERALSYLVSTESIDQFGFKHVSNLLDFITLALLKCSSNFQPRLKHAPTRVTSRRHNKMLFDTQQRIALNTQQKVWIHNKKLHAGTSGTTESLAGSHYIDQFTTYYTRSLVVGMRTRAYILRFDFIVERMFCCFCGNSL